MAVEKEKKRKSLEKSFLEKRKCLLPAASSSPGANRTTAPRQNETVSTANFSTCFLSEATQTHSRGWAHSSRKRAYLFRFVQKPKEKEQGRWENPVLALAAEQRAVCATAWLTPACKCAHNALLKFRCLEFSV